MKKITADYHLHSDVSPDCKTPMEESCEAAIQKGLTELTFTEHMEMFSGNFKRYPVSYMQQYFGNLARCREKFAGKLVLKAGVELGQGQVDREWEKTIIDLFPFDFIIGSVHKMDNVDMGKMAFADEAQTKRIIQQNLEYLWELVDTCDFDSLGHVDLVKRYATHDYDSVLELYYAKARFYDADGRHFVSMDPLKGNVADPMTMVQYVYVLNSPLNYIDIDGKMPVRWLRMIKDAYILGFIPKDYIGSVVLIANIVTLAAKTIDNIMNIVTLDVRDIYDMVTGIEDELKSNDVSRQAIYVSLHETAQVLSAKAIYNKYGASLGSLFQIFPELEDINLQLKEIDISYGSYAWEVKPIGTSKSKWLDSLKKYIDGYNENKADSDYNTWFGYRIPGGNFSSVFARMATFNGKDVYITAHWIAPGKIEYFLQLKCENQYKEISVKDFATELIPVFKKAEAVNSVTTIAVAFAAFLGAIASPVPGDEAAVGTALGNLLVAAGLA